jgi:hypothetical protein
MMKKLAPLAALCLTLLAAAAVPAHAQSGFALKAGYLFNSSVVNGARTDSLPSANGFGVGVEYVLPMGIGLGASAYTEGGLSDFNLDNGSAVFLAEANYFLRLPMLPVSPYAGVHAGLGRYSRDELVGGTPMKVRDSRDQLGYQLGMRFQATPMLGIDAQWRRVSNSAAADQDGRLERSQVLLGVTLF